MATASRGGAHRENTMALNDDWTADVRRWYFDERGRNDGTPVQGVASELADDAIGYEAAWTGAARADASPGVDAAGAARTDLR
jgi:hypothetical protein